LFLNPAHVLLGIAMIGARASEMTEAQDLGRFHSNVHSPHTLWKVALPKVVLVWFLGYKP
jgi:hypothetical protein